MPSLERCEEDGCSTRIWTSSKEPEKISLIGIRVEQKDRSFFVVRGKASDLDRISHVPRIEFNLDNKDHAQKALNKGSVDEWQRPIDSDRVATISRFFGQERNYLVNSTILSLPDDTEYIEEDVIQDGLVEITIDPKAWMKSKCDECGMEKKTIVSGQEKLEWFDRCPNHECKNHEAKSRPALIIDGQHRIRGTQGEYAPSGVRDEPLVATILPESEFRPTKQAEIFTEITTTAEDLATLHKIYLLYQFRLQAPNMSLSSPLKNNLRADFQGDTELGQRNYRAYQIMCKLCYDGGPWEDRITVLRDRKKKGDYIDGEHMVSYISQWMEKGGIFEGYSPARVPGGPPSEPEDELIDYLESIKQTWSGEWNEKRDTVGAVQSRGIIQVFLVLFEDIVKSIDSDAKSRTKSSFMDELDKISEVNWGSEWQNLESPDKNKRLLLELLRLRIKGGGPPDLNAAVASEPQKLNFEAGSKRSYDPISKKAPFELSWTRPYPAYRNANITIEQDDNVLYETTTTETQHTFGDTEFEGVDSSGGEVSIKVYYSNPNGTTTITHPIDP
jgi:hypothetical protein